MLYLTYTMISRVDLAHYGVSRAKDWILWIMEQGGAKDGRHYRKVNRDLRLSSK